MRALRWTAMAGCFAAGGMAMAAEGPGIDPGTPQIPGTPWKVHDGSRPQPPVVENAGAVEVKPPADAKVLFDGKSLDAWVNSEGKPMWPVKDGGFTASPGMLTTKDKFGPVQVHIEWRVPPGRPVKGQGGGNSGIFLMGLYEVQILQSHDNPTYADGTAGALYGQSPPLVNAIRPQGEWQSYEILFTPPKLDGGKVTEPAVATVLVNGIVVQNARKLIGPTQYRQLAKYPDNHPETGPIALQFHGDPIEFRNIWVRPIAAPN
ncbi:DUF1080 domain-containing protein [Haloferula sp. BvORR071]|uniref:3-keto-disaccharide hydrolase n=1 Tax=Haloferula sp. BvORR071 TaxID=1396141 RepID=UPI000555EB7E|nr:DUF1080 domain-containing protein [Haloferula sp. BvORR071]